MCVWTKKWGSMNAVVLMATPCPKSLHGKGEKWIARNMFKDDVYLDFFFLREIPFCKLCPSRDMAHAWRTQEAHRRAHGTVREVRRGGARA